MNPLLRSLVVAALLAHAASGSGCASVRLARAARAGRLGDTAVARVEVDSLRVVSIVDDDGLERPADATLQPPVPLAGPRELRLSIRSLVAQAEPGR